MLWGYSGIAVLWSTFVFRHFKVFESFLKKNTDFEDFGLAECDVVSLGNLFLTFRRASYLSLQRSVCWIRILFGIKQRQRDLRNMSILSLKDNASQPTETISAAKFLWEIQTLDEIPYLQRFISRCEIIKIIECYIISQRILTCL